MISTRLFTTEEVSRPAEGFYRAEVESPDRLPVLTFLPTGFEPNYAYPLVVFFHGRGSSERQLMRVAPRLSRRNYISIALRGPEEITDYGERRRAFRWGNDTQSEAYAEEYLFRALDQIRDSINIHSRRIFLAGFCEGAAHAYRLGLAFPDKFAGVVSLNGAMPLGGPLFRYPEVRKLRVLIGHGIANSVVPLSAAKKDHRLLYAAGLPVEFRTYLTTHRIHPQMLRDIDRWIMDYVTSDVRAQ